MNRKQFNFIVALIAILALGYLFNMVIRHFVDSKPLEVSQPRLSTEAFFAASLPDVSGKAQSNDQWRGKTLVVNFWATWCPPCREEMPELSLLQERHAHRGVVVLGIALDDLDKVKAFSAQSPVSYPLLAGDIEAMNMAESLGNSQSVLPYTVIIGADGHVEKTFLGRVNLTSLEKTLLPTLQTAP